MSYQKREEKAVRAIKDAIPDSLKKDMIKASKGMFAELYENNEVFPKHYLASAIDGVGTKLLIAEAMEKYDTIGIDLVAMSANDLATLGPINPFLFMDCLSCQRKIQEKLITGEIIKGIVTGLEQCDASSILKNSIRINFGKGETASVDELISGLKPGFGFDLAGCMIGFIKKDQLNTQVSIGDKIIALRSSGPHSNGYTDLRHKLLKGEFEERPEFKKNYIGKYLLDYDLNGTSIGNLLLKPTRIYLKDIAKITKNFPVVGINNTGYGLKNFNRINQKVEFRINAPLEPQPIFKLMQKESGFNDEKMYTSFNMGMGFFAIAKKQDSEDILQILKDAEIVGEVTKSDKTRTVLEKEGKKIVFEGY
ncbi:phosphoribosylformylglycinamidine cyclo-ligase [Candidatus Woesearchaeota archaeon]|nr:phosphoribosylformylglycinamidine cyclo-ligase [Candidatus Woesearchaeota archaeon]